MSDESPAAGGPVLLDIADDVATIRLNRPDRMNALTPAVLDLIRETFDQAVAEGARAVLLTGEGRAFCAGADLRNERKNPDLGDALVFHYNPMIETIAGLPIPVVTAINGAAAGAGASLALSGDIIMMARSSYLLLAFSNIGLVPDAGSTWLIAKAAGRARVLEMALLGERMSAEEAYAAGLATRVVDDEDLLPQARAIAVKLAAKPTMALGLIRSQVRGALAGSLTETLAIEAVHQSKAGFSEDFQEGVAAFREKRPAVFKGK